MRLKLAVSLCLLAVCFPASAQQDTWAWSHRLELRGDYRWSEEQFLNRPFPAGPPQTRLETPDPGHHVELNVADIQLDVTYGDWLNARVKAHGYAKHRRNPTSSDKTADVDELFIRIGPKPEFLERPDGTTVFLQAGKFTKMERQPVRLLESYGLAATSFNRFEDVQVQVGGTIGRSFYWRAQVANGNPLFMRDPNALAGDNGTEELRRTPVEHPPNGSGFPIFYNAETEDLFLKTDNLQTGEGLGFRWQRADQSAGFDILAFHYKRDLADTVELTGTFYGGDIDLIDRPLPNTGPAGFTLDGRTKQEYGARFYGEWHAATAIAQFTKQSIAGLQREGWEIEAGYRLPWSFGFIRSIQPAVRWSGIDNRFSPISATSPNGQVPAQFPAASLWWDWTKWDGGVRIGLPHNLDVTAEYTKHRAVAAARRFYMRETLVTVRWRV